MITKEEGDLVVTKYSISTTLLTPTRITCLDATAPEAEKVQVDKPRDQTNLAIYLLQFWKLSIVLSFI
jgi:hypothetical protein